MKNWQSMLIKKGASIIDALRVIDSTGHQAAFVVDETGILLGSVTDGDVRRALLQNVSLSSSVEKIMNPDPTVASALESRERIFDLMKARYLRQIPVIDADRRVVGVEILQHLLQQKTYPNSVVLMVGGRGTRLHPLTKECPKPLLKIHGKPILEIIVENLVAQGFREIFLSVNYMSEMFEQCFGDGSRLNCRIRYLKEDVQMGTAGSLSLLPEKPKDSILVMNGDLLTKLSFERLIEFHEARSPMATMCVREFDFEVPYGVVSVDTEKIIGIDEKPVQRFFVNGGVYVLNPEALNLIPPQKSYDMPTLFHDLSKKGHQTLAFPVREYWLDIGRASDFERARNEYLTVFGGL